MIDASTRHYRKRQFDKLITNESIYKTTLKIVAPEGETKWLNITEKELSEIKAILLK